MKAQQILSTIILVLSSQQQCNARSLLRRQNNDTESSNTNIDRELHGTSSRDTNTRIIGGNEAVEDRHAYAVSLYDNIGHFCGGSLIAKDVVLTAAHCKGGEYFAVAGRHNIEDDTDGVAIPMRKEVPHPQYDPQTTDNDFMVIFLERPVPVVGDNFELVKLNKNPARPYVGQSVRVMGWGDTNIRDSVSDLSDVLMKVDVDVISNNVCDNSEGIEGGWYDSYKDQITDNMLCARKVGGGQDSCQGDSGGPLVIKGGTATNSQDIQVGVVSWGVGCASANFPGVYARISRAYNWIEREVCRGSNYATEAGFDC